MLFHVFSIFMKVLYKSFFLRNIMLHPTKQDIKNFFCLYKIIFLPRVNVFIFCGKLCCKDTYIPGKNLAGATNLGVLM